MAKHTAPQTTTSGLITPAEMFDHPLPDRLMLDADLPFEERVERAWARLKLTRFTPEEHERLRTAMAERLKEKHTFKDQLDE